MKIETDAGMLVPVDIAMIPKTDKLMMKTSIDGTYSTSFILRDLFTPTELPDGLVIKSLECRFVNFDGLLSPFGQMVAFKIQVFNAD